jgi:hypothetical protein
VLSIETRLVDADSVFNIPVNLFDDIVNIPTTRFSSRARHSQPRPRAVADAPTPSARSPTLTGRAVCSKIRE